MHLTLIATTVSAMLAVSGIGPAPTAVRPDPIQVAWTPLADQDAPPAPTESRVVERHLAE